MTTQTIADPADWKAGDHIVAVDGANVSPDHYKITFKPETVVPDIEVR